MTRGIYFLANDRSLDQAIALVNSIRAYDAVTPLVMLPYAAPYRFAARTLSQISGVTVFDGRRAERWMRQVRHIFGPNYFPRPDNLRKQLCWFGPFDEFLYFDADIVVFERVVEMLDALLDYDFLCYSDQHESGIEHVFKSAIRGAGIFTPDQLDDVFNAGMWGANKHVMTEARLVEYLTECAHDRQYLDRSRGGSDQPVMNYFVLKHLPRRINLYRTHDYAPGMWAGRDYFERRDGGLYDLRANNRCRFLHWAGLRIAPGVPYWDVWREFRFMNPALRVPLDLERGKKPARRFPRIAAVWQRTSDRIWNRLDQPMA